MLREWHGADSCCTWLWGCQRQPNVHCLSWTQTALEGWWVGLVLISFFLPCYVSCWSISQPCLVTPWASLRDWKIKASSTHTHTLSWHSLFCWWCSFLHFLIGSVSLALSIPVLFLTLSLVVCHFRVFCSIHPCFMVVSPSHHLPPLPLLSCPEKGTKLGT